MDTRERLVAAALQLIDNEGAAQFSTRAVCAIADVTAPTLYHHFGSADGLVSAALTETFEQFLKTKTATTRSQDPETALRLGWDSFVRFAAERPRLCATMMGRILLGGKIPAAEHARELLVTRIEAVAAAGRLAMEPEAAADLMWASAQAAALLWAAQRQRPDPAVIDGLRDHAMQTIIRPKSKAKHT